MTRTRYGVSPWVDQVPQSGVVPTFPAFSGTARSSWPSSSAAASPAADGLCACGGGVKVALLEADRIGVAGAGGRRASCRAKPRRRFATSTRAMAARRPAPCSRRRAARCSIWPRLHAASASEGRRRTFNRPSASSRRTAETRGRSPRRSRCAATPGSRPCGSRRAAAAREAGIEQRTRRRPVARLGHADPIGSSTAFARRRGRARRRDLRAVRRFAACACAAKTSRSTPTSGMSHCRHRDRLHGRADRSVPLAQAPRPLRRALRRPHRSASPAVRRQTRGARCALSPTPSRRRTWSAGPKTVA